MNEWYFMAAKGGVMDSSESPQISEAGNDSLTSGDKLKKYPYGQHQESRPLSSPNFWTCPEKSFYNFQPIIFVRFDNTSVNRGLPVLGEEGGQMSRFLVLTIRIAASGDENVLVRIFSIDWIKNGARHLKEDPISFNLSYSTVIAKAWYTFNMRELRMSGGRLSLQSILTVTCLWV